MRFIPILLTTVQCLSPGPTMGQGLLSSERPDSVELSLQVVTPGVRYIAAAVSSPVGSFRPTPPRIVRALSVHVGVARPLGTLANTTNAGSVASADVVFPLTARAGADLHVGHSLFPGASGASDLDVYHLSSNLRVMTYRATPWPFVSAGLGLYYVDYSDLEVGYSIGVGLGQPIGNSLTIEVTANLHSIFTTSPNLRFRGALIGLLWAV